ncbi:MAG: hypothetical protein ACOYL8_00485 [Patescibacteria group bacterium]
MTTKKLITLFLFILLLPLPSLAQVAVDPNFNPNKIVDDNEFLDYDSMSLWEIQSFLESKNSYLATYRTTNAHGTIKSAAEIIYDASNNNYDCYDTILSDTPTEAEKQQKCKQITTINPKFLLILLQKESSLIEDSNPSQTRLDWATGYGIFDGMLSCSPYDKCYRYKGFGKQVNSAALQFLAYINEQNRYTYKAGQTYSISNTLDPYCTIFNQIMTVTPENRSTAALYNYTPHVFNGNYNVFKLWNRYFKDAPQRKIVKLYPDGSILQVKGVADIWLIENGKKRPFLNYSAFISRFKPEQIVAINNSDLNDYPLGDGVKFANYSLVQTPDKTVYLLVNKEKRPFANLAVIKKIGFNPEEIESANSNELNIYITGKTINATSTYVTGVLMQDTKTGGIFYVVDGTKAPLTDKILLETKFKGKKIIKATTKTLDTYSKVSPVLLDDGTLVKTDNYPTVYLISNGQKRPFANGEIFAKLGYNSRTIISVSSKFLYNYSQGEIIKDEVTQ